MGHVFSLKVTLIKYQVTEMHREDFDSLCHPGGTKISFFQDLRVSCVSYLLSRNCWGMWIYVAKEQANIMKKRILIYTVRLACLIYCQKNTLEESYTETMIYMLTLNFNYLQPSEKESNVLFLIALLHWSAKYKPLCHILNWGWLSNIELQQAYPISVHLPV